MKLSYAFVDFDKAFDKVSREANTCALMKVSHRECGGVADQHSHIDLKGCSGSI